MQEKTQTLRAGEYFLAVEGLAMIRHVLTDLPTARRRVEETRRIIERFEDFPQSLELPVTEYGVQDGYSRWAPNYDGPNPAIECETPIVGEMLASIPAGDALDAACGTGRHAATLAAMGHRVIGVDATEAMLDVARAKVPGADFRGGTLDALPVDDGSIDVLTCTLALTHVERLAPVIAEFARVLRPGGTAILSDMHPFMVMTSLVAAFPTEDGGLGVPFVLNRVHQVSEYVQAALASGFRIVACVEPLVDEKLVPVFSSYRAYPEATRDAYFGLPYLLIWRLERA